MQIKTQINMRFFAVFLVSFFCQTHLSASLTESTALSIINSEVIYGLKNPVEINFEIDLDKISSADSTKKSRALFAPVSKKHRLFSASKNIPSEEGAAVSPNLQAEPFVIYVTSGVNVINLESEDNIKVVAVKAKVKLKKVENSALSEQLKLAKAEKKSQGKLAQIKKAKELNIKAEVTFYADPSGNSDIKKQTKSFFAAIISPFNLLQKSAIHASESKYATAITLEVRQQKFSTSLSYLQFSPLRNSFLRGPPSFS